MGKRLPRYKGNTLKRVQEASIEILEEFKKICEENDLTYFLVYGSAIGAVRHGGFIPWDDDLDVGMFRDDFERFLKICENLGDDSKYELMSVLVDKENSTNVTKFQKKGTRFVSYYSRYIKANLGIAIDVFPLDKVPEDKKLRNKQMRKASIYSRLLFLRKNPFPNIPYKGIKRYVAQFVCFMIWLFLNVFHISSRWLYKQFDEAAQRYRGSKSPYVTCMMDRPDSDYYWVADDMLPPKVVPFENTTANVPGNVHDYLTLTYGDYMQLPPKEKRFNHAPIILKF